MRASRMRVTRALVAFGAAAALTAGVVACGDDDSSSSSGGGGGASKDEQVTIGHVGVLGIVAHEVRMGQENRR